ncbi:MAG: hypothetical protein AAB633_02990 [Patescibacteria group bacterium]
MATEGVVRSRLGTSVSRGVLILDRDGNPVVNSEMTADDGLVMDPDYWPEPRERWDDDEQEGE